MVRWERVFEVPFDDPNVVVHVCSPSSSGVESDALALLILVHRIIQVSLRLRSKRTVVREMARRMRRVKTAVMMERMRKGEGCAVWRGEVRVQSESDF